MTTETTPDSAIEAFLDDHRDARLESYKELLRIPSISALPEHAADCRTAADWIAADLRATGIEHVEVAETDGHPIVYGDWLHADGAPTVIVYCHYDVQPVDPLELWDSPPFEPAVVGDRILARGSADDKGQLHLHLRATEAILKTRGALPVNLKFVFEGDEESNSIHLERWLADNKDRLKADFALISDTGFFDGNLPAITVGLRGIMYAQIDVTGTAVDLHSGSYGGAVQNPDQRSRPDHRRAQGTRWADPDSRLLRRRRFPDRCGTSRDDGAPLRRGRVPRDPRPAGARR